MPTKRTPITRHRRAARLPSADKLWLSGNFVEALAVDSLVEFRHFDHTMTADEVEAAYALRRARGWDDDGLD
jgi:hypothetical protein